MTKPSSARAGNFTSVLQEFGSDTCLSGQTPSTVGMGVACFCSQTPREATAAAGRPASWWHSWHCDTYVLRYATWAG